MARIRVVATRVGGGFGGKHASNIHSIAAWLARAARRPVKLVLSRMQDFEIQRSRHPARIWMKTGARRDGTILARDVRITLDGGAYADESPPVLAFALLMSRGPYRIANARARGRAVYTNKLRAGSFRGFGNPQASFAGESQIDELAAKLGIDPVELRLRNAMRPDDTAFGGQRVPSCVLTQCLTRVREAQRAAPALAPRAGRRRGVGFAVMSHVSGLMGTAASVQLRTDGSIALSTGCVDIGQGADTVMVQICADALSVPIERVSYAPQDSDSSPYNWKTAGSRSTYMTGRAVAVATVEMRNKMFEHAAEMLECASADLELRPGGAIGIKGVPMGVSFKEIAMRSLFRSGGPIAASHGFVFDGPPFDPKRAVDPPARVRQPRRLHLRRALRGGRRRRGHRRGRGAPRLLRARRRTRDQSGQLRRPDPGRLRPGHGLRAHRGDALERRGLAHHRDACRLQDAGRARYAAGDPRDRARGSGPQPPGRRQGDRRTFAGGRGARHRQRDLQRHRGAPARPADDAGARARRTGNAVMKLADYPPQEPLSEAGQAYSAECWRRSEGIACQEVAFGPTLSKAADL